MRSAAGMATLNGVGLLSGFAESLSELRLCAPARSHIIKAAFGARGGACAGDLVPSRGIPGCGPRLFALWLRYHLMGGGVPFRSFHAPIRNTQRGELRRHMGRKQPRCRGTI